MEDLKLVGWADFDCEYPTLKGDSNYINKAINLIREDIEKNLYVFSGYDHQNHSACTPIFSDGTAFRMSMRCWGSVVAGVYEGKDGTQLTYMDFYMPLAYNKFPTESDIDIKPAKGGIESAGCVTKEDMSIIDDALNSGIGLLTTDKVMQKRYEMLKKEREEN